MPDRILIPAAGYHFLTAVWSRLGDYEIRGRIPILAWEVNDGAVVAILIDGSQKSVGEHCTGTVGIDEMHAIEEPDGRVWVGGEEVFVDVPTFVRQYTQRRKKRHQPSEG